MEHIIIGFSKLDRCETVKGIVTGSGFLDVTECTSGAEILRAASIGSGGIVICGLKLADMMYDQLYEMLPAEYSMLVLLSRNQGEMVITDDVFSLVLPVNKMDFVKTVNMILDLGLKSFQPVYRPLQSRKNKIPVRSDADKMIVEKAKLYLMNQYHVSEDAAHRFIQKNSMDKGLKMVDMAKRILND